MEKIRITLNDVLREAKKLPPERSHGRCVHFESETGEPVCAVGQILSALGATAQHVTAAGGAPINSAGSLAAARGLDITPGAVRYLTDLQDAADTVVGHGKAVPLRRPWGEAKQLADEALARRREAKRQKEAV